MPHHLGGHECSQHVYGDGNAPRIVEQLESITVYAYPEMVIQCPVSPQPEPEESPRYFLGLPIPSPSDTLPEKLLKVAFILLCIFVAGCLIMKEVGK